ncbi:hypothetical protein M2146_002581 [Lachnospiraceae bacterium PF1-22]
MKKETEQYFIAFDGIKFDTEEACRRYEEEVEELKVRDQKVKVISDRLEITDMEDIPYIAEQSWRDDCDHHWYYIENETDLKEFLEAFQFPQGHLIDRIEDRARFKGYPIFVHVSSSASLDYYGYNLYLPSLLDNSLEYFNRQLKSTGYKIKLEKED